MVDVLLNHNLKASHPSPFKLILPQALACDRSHPLDPDNAAAFEGVTDIKCRELWLEPKCEHFYVGEPFSWEAVIMEGIKLVAVC